MAATMEDANDWVLPITGRCLCGQVRIAVDEPPLAVRQCWCRLCRYLGAGNATINAAFRSESVRLEGETRDHVSIADSGNRMHRHFCPACGTPVSSSAESRPHLLFLRVGVLDAPERFAPQMNIWTALAPSWVCLDPALPAVPGQPPPAG